MIDFKGHRFEKDIILLCVRWYLAYPLSYRKLEEMMIELVVNVYHSNIHRWVQSSRRSWRPPSRKTRIAQSATAGEWTIRTSSSRASENIFTASSTMTARPSTSYPQPIATRKLPCAFSRKQSGNTACRKSSGWTRAAPIPRPYKRSRRNAIKRSRYARSST